MPRATTYRRQEVRHLRRLARLSTSMLVLDEDLVAPGETWAEPASVDATSERNLQDWFVTLSPEKSRDH